jgi:hypothetical protein
MSVIYERLVQSLGKINDSVLVFYTQDLLKSNEYIEYFNIRDPDDTGHRI